jgi:hypothetical protein
MKALFNTFLSLIFVGTLSANTIELHPEYEALFKGETKVSYTKLAKNDFKRMKEAITKLKKTSTADYVILVSKFRPVIRDNSVRYFSENGFEFEEVTAKQVLNEASRSIEWESNGVTKKSCLFVKTSSYIKRLEEEQVRKAQEEAKKIAARREAEEWRKKQASIQATEEANRSAGYSSSSSYSGGTVHVSGHWRRTRSGKLTWVRGYTRRK